MPVPAAIAGAAGEFAHNSSFLQKAVADLTPEQWLCRPGDHSNHITWIVGHVIWSRHALINRVGGKWSCPGIEVFARSAKLDVSSDYPSSEALLALWRDSATALDAPPPPGPPSPDGKVRGFIGVLAWHETYHLGQIAYLRSWLGQSGIFG